MQIPLLDLKRQYRLLCPEIEDAVINALAAARYIMGENVLSFEKEFAEYMDMKHAISVANGTDALVISLRALGIGPGDEVITTPYTFFASAESIAAVGAVPVFVDVREDTYNINENLIQRKITKRTKAIMPVDIFGQCCAMDSIYELAERNGLKVLEDACQAVGAKYKNKMAGGYSHIACYSFFPTKNLGCAGDGGMICTNDDDLANVCKALRVHGSGEMGRRANAYLRGESLAEEAVAETVSDNTVYNPSKYYNHLIGCNSRLDEVQAALLRVKLRKLDEFISARRTVADYYNNALVGLPLVTPFEDSAGEHSYHQYVLLSEDRDAIIAALKERGVASGIYYPVPLHLQKVFGYLGYTEGQMPVSEHLSKRMFAIPIFPELYEEEMQFVAKALQEAVGCGK